MSKAIPFKLVEGKHVECTPEEATHLMLNLPCNGHSSFPVQIKGSRAGTGNWTWNGSIDDPTLKPSVLLSQACDGKVYWKSHMWVNDGKCQYLNDSTHDKAGQNVELLPVDKKWL